MASVRVDLDRQQIRERLPHLVSGEMHRRAEAVAELARATAPKDSGRWAASIRVEDHVQPGAYRVGSDDPRSIHIEYGTSDTPDHATLRRALDAAKKG